MAYITTGGSYDPPGLASKWQSSELDWGQPVYSTEQLRRTVKSTLSSESFSEGGLNERQLTDCKEGTKASCRHKILTEQCKNNVLLQRWRVDTYIPYTRGAAHQSATNLVAAHQSANVCKMCPKWRCLHFANFDKSHTNYTDTNTLCWWLNIVWKGDDLGLFCRQRSWELCSNWISCDLLFITKYSRISQRFE